MLLIIKLVSQPHQVKVDQEYTLLMLQKVLMHQFSTSMQIVWKMFKEHLNLLLNTVKSINVMLLLTLLDTENSVTMSSTNLPLLNLLCIKS